MPTKPSFHSRCIFTEGGVKCGDRIIPCSKYCRKHILEDRKQVLFRACNTEKAGVLCKESVPGIFEDTTCTLHIQLPPQRNYTQKKYESDTDDETMSVKSPLNIKKEDVNETDSQSTTQSTQAQDQEKIINETKQEEAEEVSVPEDVDKNVTICHDDSIGQKPPQENKHENITENATKPEPMEQ